MDASANKEVPESIAAKFTSGFPANFKELISEAEAISALHTADLADMEDATLALSAEAEAEATGGQSAGDSASGGRTSKSCVKAQSTERGKKTSSVKGQKQGGEEKRGGRGGGRGAGESIEVESQAAVGWKNLTQMTVADSSSLSTSRSGRKLHKPCDFWRQQVPVYEGTGAERRLVGVAEGEQDLTSNFFSDHARTPRTPVSGRKAARTPPTADDAPGGAGGGGPRGEDAAERQMLTDQKLKGLSKYRNGRACV